MRRVTFSAPSRLFFEAMTTSGDVEVLPATDGELVVELRGGPEDEYTIELAGSGLLVSPPVRRSGKRRLVGTDIKLSVPADATGEIRTASGDVMVLAELEGLSVATASGDIRATADMTGDLEIKTASGDTRARSVAGSVSMATASGDAYIQNVGGDVRFNSASGDLRTGRIAGTVDIKTASGDVTVGCMAGHSVRGRTLSGSVRLALPPGRTVDLDMQTLSGDLVNRIDRAGSDGPRVSLAISLKTVSGDLLLESC